MAMTPTEFAKKMKDLRENGPYPDGYWVTERDPNDIEDMHVQMDELMCEVLKDLGYSEGVETFTLTAKWYA